MNWKMRVEEWENNPVTKHFKEEIKEDIAYLSEALLDTEPMSTEINGRTVVRHKTPEDYMQLRGMIKALRGVLAMGVTDPIQEEITKKEGKK